MPFRPSGGTSDTGKSPFCSTMRCTSCSQWDLSFPGPPGSERAHTNTRDLAVNWRTGLFDHIASFHHLRPWRYSTWPVHRHLSLLLSIFLCTLYNSYVCLHAEVQTLGQLEGVVGVQTINRRVKNQSHDFCWSCTHGQLC